MVKFDIHTESQTIKAGTHFWCSGCISARPVAERSADSRYCQGCHDFLCIEADTLPKKQRGDWVPRLPATAAPAAPCDINPNGESAIGNIVTGNNQEGKGKEHRKRGRPRSARNTLPLEKIQELHQSGHK